MLAVQERRFTPPCDPTCVYVQYLIQLIAHRTINNHLLFFDAPTACFVLYRPSSGRSLMQQHDCDKLYQRCARMELKYNVINYNTAKVCTM